MMNKHKLGILAYGSLIDDPGKELEPLIIDIIECKTPFKVEYARKSKKRGYGPTLIPFSKAGRSVNAKILILKNEEQLQEVVSMLYRREIGTSDFSKHYVHTTSPGANTVQIIQIKDFMGIECVLYTKIASNINDNFKAEDLAELAICSILSSAGEEGCDGIRYLEQNLKNNIITEYSEAYVAAILDKTGSISLADAIKSLDKKRNECT